MMAYHDTGIPDAESIKNAYELIRHDIHQTPVLTSHSTNLRLNCNLFFKCENFQKAGAFKFRGASYALSMLNAEELTKGVCTHSSGNHAQALSLAALFKGAKSYVVMPDNSPKVKINAVKNYKGDITFCEPTLEARELNLSRIQQQTGAVFIHPYNDYNIIHGQATCYYEMLQQMPQAPDYVIVPVGGGGLLSGTLLTNIYFSPNTKVIGAEPRMADDACRSFYAKKLIPSENPKTIADGLKTSLGSLTFPIIADHAHDIITVSENSIKDAMYWIWERLKIIIEPSAAVSLAVVMENQKMFKKKNIALILTGGNVDLNRLPWLNNYEK
jgi:threonine dehydratase